MAFIGMVAYFAFSLFCLKKGDDWGAGAFILWASVNGLIAVAFGTV